MQQEQEEKPALQTFDYAKPRFRFAVHLPTVLVAIVVVIAVNLWPHFVATVGKSAADVPEPEAGWPWVFYYYGQSYAGYGAWCYPQRGTSFGLR